MSINVKIKKLSPNAIIPIYAKEGDSGIDLYTLENTVIPARSAVAISTGIALEIPFGYEMQVRPRSGISLNGIEGMFFLNAKTTRIYPTVRFGTVDSGYRGEIKIITYNEEDFEILIPKHTKLAQGVFQQVPRAILKVVDELSNSERGNSGFGSTGIK
ncbi:TPA: dUTP diphosphatase [Clostridioides difficile]|nr:dUTP diphosphatase [Clostridioides difficile]EJX3377900.1 dUTP diphosphatase [Clostridioides difficile]MCR1424741.1 dUTP diphosphatase [Clostridioides difficile]MCR1674187.1 dUTP diphosphatase [Clostridioides difficile]MDE3700361.1 dUTP diphosphatase [Clostridioides difficile]